MAGDTRIAWHVLYTFSLFPSSTYCLLFYYIMVCCSKFYLLLFNSSGWIYFPDYKIKKIGVKLIIWKFIIWFWFVFLSNHFQRLGFFVVVGLNFGCVFFRERFIGFLGGSTEGRRGLLLLILSNQQLKRKSKWVTAFFFPYFSVNQSWGAHL